MTLNFFGKRGKAMDSICQETHIPMKYARLIILHSALIQSHRGPSFGFESFMETRQSLGYSTDPIAPRGRVLLPP